MNNIYKSNIHYEEKLLTSNFHAVGGHNADGVCRRNNVGNVCKQDGWHGLSGIQNVTFKDGNLCVNFTSGTTESYGISGITKITFKNDQSGVTSVKAAVRGIYPSMAESTVALRGFEGEVAVRIYSVDGSLLCSIRQDAQEPVYVGNLAHGIYLLNVNGQSFKFCKR